MAEEQWYLLIGQERQGPMSVHDVRYLLTRRNIDGGTLVWKEGMPSWVRLREIEEFLPKKKEADPPAAEQPEESDPEKVPLPTVRSAFAQRLMKLIPLALTLGLVGGALYVFVSDDTSDTPSAVKTRKPNKRRIRSPEALVESLKRGDASARDQLVLGGSRSVPALIQALLEKGSPLHSTEVKAILIEIGPSSASAIGDALEGIDLSKVAQIILVEVLGEFGGLTSVPSLIVALGSPDIEVQERAIEAISKLDPAIGPALARRLTSPVQELSKRQKKNLAQALGEHGSPESIPIMQQAQRSERDAEVIAALAKAVEQISRNPRTGSPTTPAPVIQVNVTTESDQGRQERQENQKAPPPQNISVSVSATATATATAEGPDEEPSDEPPEPDDEQIQKAKELAAEGDRLRDEGKDEEALAKYKEAYALHPIRIYLLVILSMEGLDEFAASAKADSLAPPPPLPEIEVPKEVALSEIYAEMEASEPDLSTFSGDLGTWVGTPDAEADVTRDGNRDLYLVRGTSGQDFIAAVNRREISVNRTAKKTWRGTLQGFRIILDGTESRMLPVLSVDRIE